MTSHRDQGHLQLGFNDFNCLASAAGCTCCDFENPMAPLMKSPIKRIPEKPPSLLAGVSWLRR